MMEKLLPFRITKLLLDQDLFDTKVKEMYDLLCDEQI